MRKNAERTIAAFLSGKACTGDHKRTIHTDGRILYSYDLPIASRGAEGTIVLTEAASPSRTTTGQIRALRYAVPSAAVVANASVVVAYAAETARGESGPTHASIRAIKAAPLALKPSMRRQCATEGTR